MASGYKIALISGFLGSGKTTLILTILGRPSRLQSQRVAILVNDFGRIGIDGKVMQKYGLRVKEIHSGCICCTMGADLLSSIEAIREEFDPNLIVIEPSGVADPGGIKRILQAGAETAVDRLRTVAVLDAVRHETISRALGPLVEKQLKAADYVLINKADQVNREKSQAIERFVRAAGIRAPILTVSAKTGLNVEHVLEILEG